MNGATAHTVEIAPHALPALLELPDAPRGVVLFAHGSGSSRLSPRNQAVAAALREAGLATLLMDLLTPQEACVRRLVFDIPLLASRLSVASAWLRECPHTAALPLGYFGASTGAGAALLAAAEQGERVQAVVSRGGRPDLAGPALARVLAPTLLVVGALDLPVIELNLEAMEALRCRKQLAVVPGAGHLFEEPGTLDEMTRLATGWFTAHLGVPAIAARVH